MTSLRWRIFFLLAWLMLFFNIERLDIGGYDTINLASGVYVIGIIAAVAALTPFVQKYSVIWLLAPTLVAYFIALAIDPKVQIVGGINTYISFTGLVMLVITVLLSYWVGRSVEEFASAIEEITFSNKGERLRSMNEAEDTVQVEMISSRRRQRPMSLVLLQADASALDMLMHKLVQEVQRSMMQRYVLVTVARVLSRYLRRTDMIIEGHKPGRLMFVAPETSAEEAEILGHRMTKLARERLGVTAGFSIATFPEQALTFEELVNVAEQGLRERQAIAGAIEPEEEMTSLAEQRLHDTLAAQSQPELPA